MSSSSLIGRRLGKYEITELLGQGGMATVYKGYQPDMDRFVAIKVLPPHPGQSAQFMDRFRLEARTIAQLQHPHILPVHDYGTEGQILYLVMAYVEGGSLKDRIAEGPIPTAEAETILRQVASALDYAHRRGVIHRDIKPDNILLDGEGHAILADFGIVKILEGEGTSGLTATGGVLGTPAYMAPEQSQGTGISASVDIYSLGVIVYEMLSGQQPYQADTPMQVMLKHITEPVPGLPKQPADLPAAIEPVLMRALAKQPEDRYPTASQFAQDFLRALHYEDTAVNVRPATQRTEPASAIREPQPTPPEPSQVPVPAPVATIPPVPVSQTDTNPPAPPHGTNPILLLGGFAIIALLAVLIVLVVVQNNDAPTTVAAIDTAVPTTEPTAAATDAPATDAPTAVAAAPEARTFGRLSFNTTGELGDTVDLQVNGLRQPGRGSEYAVWLTNTNDDSVLPVGELSVDGLGNGVLRYVDEEGRMLPAMYNGVIITQEEEAGDEPTGEVVYSASNPVEVSEALSEIFIASENGFSGGSLFGGALAEAELAVIHTSYEHGTHDLFGLHNRTEHTINILMGTEIDYDDNDLAENPGFKLGLQHFLDHIQERLTFDYSAEGVRSDLRSDATRVEACLRNVEQRLEAFFAMETGWTELAEATESFAQSEIRKSEGMIADLIEGIDRNQNNQIEGFPGECGLRQIPTFALLIAHMNLVEGEL